MPKPIINANDLRNQMARGAMGTSAPGSAGNIMAGANMRPAMPAMGGATAGTQANPARNGMPAPVGGSPLNSGMGAPTLDSVRTHSLALGGLKHMVAAGHIAPQHAKAMEAKSRAHIAAYKAKGAKPPAAPKFGALGGAPMPTDNDGY